MLLQIFAAWPMPSPPQCTTRAPMISSRGRTRSKTSSGAPTMNASVPAVAPTTPPETGASAAVNPFSRARAAASCASEMLMVEQSRNVAPAGAAASRPSPPPAPV